MHREQAQRPAVGQPVVDKVEAPAFVGLQRSNGSLRAPHALLLAAAARAHLQALGPVEPMDPLVVVPDPFPAQQHEQTAIAPAAAHRGMPPQGRSHRLVVPATVGLIVIAAHSQVQQPAGSCPARRISLLQIIHGGAASSTSFFEFTSLSIRMSRAWSATIFFSSLFSR